MLIPKFKLGDRVQLNTGCVSLTVGTVVKREFDQRRYYWLYAIRWDKYKNAQSRPCWKEYELLYSPSGGLARGGF